MLRFALSPIDDMHISDLRVALFNYIIAKQKGENLIVRVEDTHKEKNREGKENEILDILALFGIEYTQVIHQSQNVRFHAAMALQLLHEKKAFSCFCSPEWIKKKHKEAKEANIPYQYDDACRNLPAELVIDNTNPFTIRIAKPDKTISIKDYIKGDLNFEPNVIDSFIIMNQDKTPTYDFASGVDDMLNDISIVICSEEHINNTPKQDHIRTSLQYDKKIEYAHLPAILHDNGEKTNKHEEILNVKWLLKEGYLPEAIANYLLLMGNKTPQEIFTIKEAIEWFNLQNISQSPTHFSIDMLKHINQEHLRALDSKELSRYVGFADEEIGELARFYLKEVGTTKELKAKIAPIFEPRVIPEEFKEYSKLIVNTIKSAPFFEEYNDFKNHIMKETGLKGEAYSKTIRLLLINAEDGPNEAEVYKYIKNYLREIIK